MKTTRAARRPPRLERTTERSENKSRYRDFGFTVIFDREGRETRVRVLRVRGNNLGKPCKVKVIL